MAAAVESWDSSDPTVVTVTNGGAAIAVANGSAIVTAHFGSIAGSTAVTVWQKVATVTAAGPATIGSLGSKIQLSATAKDAGGTAISGRTTSWSSMAPTVVSINATSGVATAAAAGNATLRATVDGVNGDHAVSVVQVLHALTVNLTLDTLRALTASRAYAATAKDSGGSPIASTTVSWTSSNATIATVSAQGLATAVDNGTTYMRAEAGTLKDSLQLVVRQRIDVSKSKLSKGRFMLFVGDSVRVTVQGRDSLDQAMRFGGAIVAISSPAGGSSGLTAPGTIDRNDGTYTADFVGTATGSSRTIMATIGASTLSADSLRVVGFTKVAVGWGPRTCGIITTGDLYCWGSTAIGARGLGPNVVALDTVPTRVSGGLLWTHLSIGLSHQCGISSAAKLYCWGSPSQGALADGTNGSLTVMAPRATIPDSNFAWVSSTLTSGSCAITVGHKAMCWGPGSGGRLGNGAESDALSPVAVSGGFQFATSATSYTSSCGITDSGTAMCWGLYYTLGTGGPYPDTCSGGLQCAKTPVATAGGLSFKPMVVNDGNQACAIGTNDKTYCWGFMSGLTPAEVAGAPTFSALVNGDMDYCGLASGTVYCWGTNRNGRFADPPNGNQTFPTPVVVAAGHSFTQIAMGQSHMCGIKADGNAFCWGANGSGELGDRTMTPSATPVRVRLFAP